MSAVRSFGRGCALVGAFADAFPGALVGALAGMLVLAGCASTPRPSLTPPALHFLAPATLNEIRWAEHPLVLLGEVHDNAHGHQLRAEALAKWLAGGARPTLILEQFDRERQGAIDSVRERGGDADAIIAAGEGAAARPSVASPSVASPSAVGSSGWAWTYYKPMIELAVRYRLPLIAGNVSRADTRKIIGQGLAAHGFAGDVPADIQAAQTQGLVDGHCGALDLATARTMVPAQIARDQFMAQMIEKHRSNGVVLIAGNGHVRRDIGVPRWLSAESQSRAIAVGYVEVDSGNKVPEFDVVIEIPRQIRTDPCEVFRER